MNKVLVVSCSICIIFDYTYRRRFLIFPSSFQWVLHFKI